MPVKIICKLLPLIILSTLLTACLHSPANLPAKIALLAPFEGRYQEIGYEALYAVRLALADNAVTQIDLLPIDDGGSPETAQWRARAITHDPTIAGIILLGEHASSQQVQAELPHHVPIIIAGYWGTLPVNTAITMLDDPHIEAYSNVSQPLTDVSFSADPLIGGMALSLSQVPQLLSEMQEDIHIYTVATLPDTHFTERYRNSAEFVPEPRLIATLAYDVTQLMLLTLENPQPPTQFEYDGLLGHLRLEGNYWRPPHIHHYGYQQDDLVLIETLAHNELLLPSMTP